MSNRLKSYLETAANISVVGLCVGFGFLIFQRGSGSPPAAAANTRPSYAVGEVLQPLPGVDFDSYSKTLLVFFQSSCRYCTDSMPFYRRLRQGQLAREANLQLVGIAPEPLLAAGGYLREHDVAFDKLFQVDRGDFKFRGTPTLLLVDSERRILKEWRGLLSSTAEAELERVVFE